MSSSSLEDRLRRAGQEHLWEHLQKLEGSQRGVFEQQLSEVDFDRLRRIFLAATAQPSDAGGDTATSVSPIEGVAELASTSTEDRQRWRALGLAAIGRGEVGGLLLAGGQGTRLGSSEPKGCYDIGLPSGRSLFALHAQRVLALQRLAVAERFDSCSGGRGDGDEGDQTAGNSGNTTNSFPKPIPLCIMTSAATDTATRAHFAAHDYFGLDREQVFFFSQGALAAVDEAGRALLGTESSLALSPDGNGGVYAALAASGALAWLQAAGVKGLDVWPVDNALARPLAPAWVGRCLEGRASLGCRVTAKTSADERVGVLARRADGGLGVVEYSELSSTRAEARGNDGRLLYRWANLCLHWFALDWLDAIVDRLESGERSRKSMVPGFSNGIENSNVGTTPPPPYHVARKHIPTPQGAVPGIKMELFIFDAFGLFPEARVAVVEVERAEEFAPVKNAPGSGTDCPETARDAVLRLHARWVERAGGCVTAEPGVEVAPALSYDGEGLEGVCKGATFDSPFDPRLQGNTDHCYLDQCVDHSRVGLARCGILD